LGYEVEKERNKEMAQMRKKVINREQKEDKKHLYFTSFPFRNVC